MSTEYETALNAKTHHREEQLNEADIARQCRATLLDIDHNQELQWQMFEYAFDAMFIINRHNIIEKANAAAGRIFGYAMQAWPGMNIVQLIPDVIRCLHDRNDAHIPQAGEACLAERYNEADARHLDGHLLPINMRVFNLHGSKGLRMLIIRDINDRKQCKDELEALVEERTASLRKLTGAVTHAGESIIITDSNGVIEYVNPAFTRMTGYRAEEVLGQTPAILKSGNQDDMFYQTMWATISAGHVWHGKVIDRKKDGSFFPVMLTISPVFDTPEQQSDFSHYVGIHADLSAIYDMEGQFQQAQKMEALGTLVGGIAHNFNNMLAGMNGNLYLAKTKIRDATTIARLNLVESISKQAAEMIQQLLAFASQDVVSMKAMDFKQFIVDSLPLFQLKMPKSITFHQAICTETLWIEGDANQLHQVLMNALNNARDGVETVEYPQINIHLDIVVADDDFLTAHPQSKPGRYACLGIKDNGCGFPNDLSEHLFEPFFTTKEQGKGTGLGLTMVYGALKTHHGFAEISNQTTGGTSLNLFIPLLDVHDGNQVQEIVEIEAKHELVLLAEDKQELREIMSEVIQSMNYRVLPAADGLQALELFTSRRYDIDLVILDVMIPHLDGIILAEKIRMLEPDMPVIFLTGHDKDVVMGDQHPMPNSISLTKPVDFDVLQDLIEQMLGK